jgi:hypothetical protein
MIQYIALGLALDAEGKSSAAVKKAREAKRSARQIGMDPFVILRPVELETVWVSSNPKVKGWRQWFTPGNYKSVLNKEPIATVSIRRSDILSIKEYSDGDDNPYVYLRISEDAKVMIGDDLYIGLKIPGSANKILKVLNGVS